MRAKLFLPFPYQYYTIPNTLSPPPPLTPFSKLSKSIPLTLFFLLTSLESPFTYRPTFIKHPQTFFFPSLVSPLSYPSSSSPVRLKSGSSIRSNTFPINFPFFPLWFILVSGSFSLDTLPSSSRHLGFLSIPLIRLLFPPFILQSHISPLFFLLYIFFFDCVSLST